MQSGKCGQCMTNKSLKSAISVFCVLLFLAAPSTATSDNSLLKLDLNKNSQNEVNVTLYTKSDYKEPVQAFKKSQNEYVIFLPQTKNAIVSKPMIKGADGVISNVDITSHTLSNSNKSYTKIILKTNNDVDFNIKAQSLPTNIPNVNSTENELNAIIAAQKIKNTSQYPKTKKINKAKIVKTTPKIIAIKKSDNFISKKISKPKVLAKVSTQKTIEYPQMAAIQTQTPQDIVKDVISKTTTQNNFENYSFDEVIPVNANMMLVKDKSLLQRINFAALIAAILFPLGIIGLILSISKYFEAKKSQTKTRKKSDKIIIEIDNSDGLINTEKLDWDGKYRKIKLNNINEIPFGNESKNSNNLISKPNQLQKNHSTVQNKQFISTDYKSKIGQNQFARPEAVLQQVIAQNLKQNPIKQTQPKFVQRQIQKPFINPNLLADSPISPTKGFYLIRYENETVLVGYINDKIFVLNKFNDMIETKLETMLSENLSDRDIYFVKCKDKKSIIEVKNNSMSLMLEI